MRPLVLSVRDKLDKAFVAVIEKLTPEQAEKMVSQLLTAMEKATNPSARYELDKAFVAVAGKLTPEQAEKMVPQLLAIMEKATDFSAQYELAKALGVVAGKLTPEQGEKMVPQFLTIMEKATDFSAQYELAKALLAMPGEIHHRQLIDLMKWPMCVGKVREAFLVRLEQKTGQKFEGNIWKMASWAQKSGFDIKGPPQRPSRLRITEEVIGRQKDKGV